MGFSNICYFNPRAPRGARPFSARLSSTVIIISIHVPREGHDGGNPSTLTKGAISIHVPREGHDRGGGDFSPPAKRFQSTCPARGTTLFSCYGAGQCAYFNPRAPRGARRRRVCLNSRFRDFNPRAPRGARRCASSNHQVGGHFNPRAPRGARQHHIAIRALTKVFQSTCPARGTTANMHNFFVQICARVTNIPLKGMPYLQKTYVCI